MRVAELLRELQRLNPDDVIEVPCLREGEAQGVVERWEDAEPAYGLAITGANLPHTTYVLYGATSEHGR